MYHAEQIALAKELLSTGVPKSAVARQLRISRRVIYYWLSAGYLDAPTPARRVRARRKAHKLAPYYSTIDARITEEPELSAPRLLEELRVTGYQGGITQLRLYLATRRPGRRVAVASHVLRTGVRANMT